MQEGGSADRADFAVAEEAAQGDGGADFVVEHLGVVVGLAVEVFAAAQAGKEQGAVGRVFPVVQGVAFQDGG